MFTGLIQETGTVVKLESQHEILKVSITAVKTLEDIKHGSSISVNGVCLTVVDFDTTSFSIEAVKETCERSTLGSLGIDAMVNLESPLRAADPIGGHFVQGHVDCTATVSKLDKGKADMMMQISIPEQFKQYVVPKGSIALDGISLTVAHIHDCTIHIAVIPETLAKTTLGRIKAGDNLNVEFDVLGKYVERLVSFK